MPETIFLTGITNIRYNISELLILTLTKFALMRS
jgi:hypothetical protein